MQINFIDPVHLFIVLAILVILVGLILFFNGLVLLINRGTSISHRLDHYVSTNDTPMQQGGKGHIFPREISGSFFRRMMSGFGTAIKNFIFNFAPDSMTKKLEHDLLVAGSPANIRARDFYFIQFFSIITGLLLGVLLNLENRDPVDIVKLALGALVLIMFAILPRAWLSRRMTTTREQVRRDLPDALDMLSVCASAGLGFDQSLQKISVYWSTTLGIEIRRTLHEMDMGISRSDALTNLSNRLDVDDLSRFIKIIIQAETMGMSYADVLHSQALQMRVLRQFRAREIANRLPAKMIIPLAVMIFPALLAVIIGPVIPTLFDLF